MEKTEAEKTEIEQGEEEKFRTPEVAAILAHLYYLEGEGFEVARMPRYLLAELLGVSRYTIWRCMRYVTNTLDLAVELKKNLAFYRKEKEEEVEKRRQETRRRYNARRNEKARLERAANTDRAPKKRRKPVRKAMRAVRPPQIVR